jgi:hypothetical protein
MQSYFDFRAFSSPPHTQNTFMHQYKQRNFKNEPSHD